MSGTALHSLLDRSCEALPSGPWQWLPLAGDAIFTENGQRLPFGCGLWRTATAVAPARAMIVADDPAGQIAGWGMITEAGQDAILGTRLRVGGDGMVTETETFVIRKNDMATGGSGFMEPVRLQGPTPGLLDVVPEAERPSRQELVAAADGYLDGVSGVTFSELMAEVLDPGERPSREDLIESANGYLDGVARDDADLIPAAGDCLRVENGLQTVLNPDAVGFPANAVIPPRRKPGVRDQIRTLAYRYIEDIRDRDILVIDTSRGLVLVRCFFDHPGQLRGADFDSPIATPNSMLTWGLFKVRGGLIRRIEVIGLAFPYGMRSGW